MINDSRQRMITFYMLSYKMTYQQAEKYYTDSHCMTFEPPVVTNIMFTEYNYMRLQWYRTKQAMALIEMRLYYPAILMAFTFPEICGRVKYPDMEIDRNKSEDQQYFVKWFDENVTQYFGVPEKDKGSGIKSGICLNGYLAYKIRCQLVHCKQQSLDDVPNNKKSAWMKQYKAVHFRFTGEEFTIRKTHTYEGVVYFDIGVPQICRQIIRVADTTYRENKDNPLFQNDIEGIITKETT